MAYNPLPNAKLSNYEIGYGDYTMKCDMDSLREINYINDHKNLFLFCDLEENSKAVKHAPRYLLKESVDKLKEIGFNVQVDCELNFSVFNEKYRKLQENISHAVPITEHANIYNSIYQQSLDDFFNKIKSSLKVSNINTEYITGDEAPGQFKIKLSTVDPMEFCDNVTLLKLVRKIL